jgi:DICT domain-containing protein
MAFKKPFITSEGQLAEARNDLSPEREAKLRIHLALCGTPLAVCLLCRELYESIGHDAYTQALVEGITDDADSIEG